MIIHILVVIVTDDFLVSPRLFKVITATYICKIAIFEKYTFVRYLLCSS
jgi:hypothetical protein